MGVRPDLEPGAVLALVHVRVDVADDRVPDLHIRVLEERDRPDVDHLVDRRGQRDGRAGHPRDAWAPDAARDHDRLGLDVAVVRSDARDATLLHVDAGHLDTRADRERAQLLRLLAHERPRLQRIDDGHAGRVEAAENDLLVDERHQLLDVARA